jgi:NAD-dependent dihydropyrimidine dehydrogenase PreA subunit
MRKIVRIDEAKCTGCGECAIDCHEDAIQIINGKAVVDNSLCDGLGACIGSCPENAITIVEVEEGAPKLKPAARKIKPSAEHGAHNACPGSMARTLQSAAAKKDDEDAGEIASRLCNWPVQIKLVPINAPYLDDADLLIAADCVPFACPEFHRNLLAGKVAMIGCPKLDDSDFYLEKLTEVFRQNSIKSVDVAYMEVPCCFGLVHIVRQAIADSGKAIKLNLVKVGIDGQLYRIRQTDIAGVAL